MPQQHVQNPEQSLLLELQAAACGQPLPSRVWQDFAAGVVDALGGQGSQNWPLMAAAVCYVETGTNSPLLLAFFKKSETMFMGTELLSPTYGVWGHLLPVAVIHAHAVKVGDAATATAALGWLQFFWALVGACTAPDGSILSIGWRASRWQDPERDSTLLAWVRGVGTGSDTARWEIAAHRLGLGLGQSPVRAIALAVQGSLAAGLAPAPIPAYRTMTPIHQLAGDGWLAVYLEANGNSNTPPRMAGSWEPQDAPSTYLPRDYDGTGLRRVRGEFDHGVVTHDDVTMTLNSSIYGTSRFGIPSLNFTETVLGAGGANAAPAPAPVIPGPTPGPVPMPFPSPIAPPPPGEGPVLDFAAMAATVAALQVPAKQQGLRNDLADALRKGPAAADRGALADQLSTLGIGDGQEQTPQWKDVIAKLRGRH